MSRTLVVYYSRTGHTQEVAAAIAKALSADIEAISDPTPRRGLWGYLRSGRQAFFKKVVPIAASERRPEDYDLVVVGSPIWNASLSAPVRSYLRRHRGHLPAVAFFCTCGGSFIGRIFREMTAESGCTPLATLAIRDAQLGTSGITKAIDYFVQNLRRPRRAA